MTDERTLDEKLETRKIPRFDIPPTKVRKDFHGQETVVRRTTCERSAVSMHRLLNLVGPTLLKLFSWSDDNAPTEDGKKTLGDVMGMSFDSDLLKSAAVIEALPELKERIANLRTDELWFHVRNLLIEHLTVGGCPINSEADLDATGIDLPTLMPLVFDSLEVNYFSTFAGRATSSGDESEPANPPNVVPMESQPNPTHQPPTSSSGRGATRKAGRSGRTRKS